MKRRIFLMLMLCLLLTLCACRAGGVASAGDTSDSDAVHTHSFGAWITVVAPTCNRVGNEMAACDCGHNTTRLIEAKGHSFVDWTIVKAGTCTTQGYETSICANGCGAVENRATDVMHTYGPWTAYREYTHGDWWEGERRYCACGIWEERQHEHVFDVLVEVVAPNCGNDGYSIYTCACNNTDGGYVMGDFVKATGKHTFGAWQPYEEYTHGTLWKGERRYCACGTWEDREHVHEFNVLVEVVAPNCGNDGYSIYTCACNDTDGGYMMGDFVKATGKHTFGAWQPHEEYIHGSLWKGERRYCACGTWEDREHVHEFNVLVEEKAPTCGHQGYQVFKCACDDGGRMTSFIDPTGEHTFGPWVVSVAPSLVTFGEECRNCTVCGKIEYREMAP